jgi:hypothetical protein
MTNEMMTGQTKAVAPTVRPLRLLSGSRLAGLHSKVFATLQAWGADWGIEPTLLALDCARAWEQGELAHQPWQMAGAGVWLTGASGLKRQLAALWWGTGNEGNSDGLAAGSHAAAADDLTSRLCALTGQHDGAANAQPSPANCFAYASGAVLLQINIAPLTLRVLLATPQALLGPESPAAPKTAQPKPVPLHHGIGRQAVRLQVEVGQSVVPLPALLTLAPGDVIRLNSPIDQPTRILAPGGSALFAGYLGKIEQSIAVELTPLGNKNPS